MRYFCYGLFFFFLAFSATSAYRINYDTRDLVKNIKLLKTKIQTQEEKSIMLKGEWAYLNRPDRLTMLTEHFFSQLGLMPISVENFANIDAISIKSSIELYLPPGKLIIDDSKAEFGAIK